MIENATMDDCEAILKLVNKNADKGLMLPKTPYMIYKNITNFLVWKERGRVVGCCRLAIVWNDLAEIASLAISKSYQGKGIGKKLVQACLQKAQDLKIKQVFVLSYQVEFFKKCGFKEVPRESLPYKVFGDCLNCPKVNCCDEKALILPLDI